MEYLEKEKQEALKQMGAGIFFIFCVMLIVVVVFVLGTGKGFAESKFTMTVLFRKVGGLNVGAPVRVSGVNVGTVSDISFLDQEIAGRSVKVQLRLLEKYHKQLRKSHDIEIIPDGLLGEMIMEISTDHRVDIEDLSRPMIGKDPIDGVELAKSFGDAAISLKEASETLGSLTGEMDKIFTTTKRLLNRVEERVIEGNLFKLF
jgi:phospholipid/cholesterol/gamma-HCH transport system substrate-binding protein